MQIEQNKIIFTGPAGVGKTTAINALSDIPTAATEVRNTDMAAASGHSAAAFDYGVVKLPNDERIHLYGSPGQEPFDAIPGGLVAGSLGVVLLLDNARSDPFRDLKFFLKAFEKLSADTKLVIGVTRMELKAMPSIDEYHQQLYGTKLKPPVFEVDVRERRDVTLLVQALLYCLDPGLRN
jgi:signal recognition particle receptor subunit beta